MDSDDCKDVQMAAILHDIGKFWQRSYKKYHRTSHEKLSKSFVKFIGQNTHVENMVLCHMGKNYSSSLNQKDKFLAEIIQKSDSYSSKEREDRINGVGDTKIEPLISVFSKLALNGKNNAGEYFYPVKKLELKNFAFPMKSKKDVLGKLRGNLQPSYEIIWEEFNKDVKKVPNKYLSFDTMYHMIKKYTTFIPSAVYVNYPDIALFDHLKTTAAIAICMYIYVAEKGERSINEKTKYFTMLSGDISGIQDFIYDISSPRFAYRGMAKRLRGRSLYSNLLNENLARIIVDRLELTDANILWCGGGHFLIIIPNTDKTEKILEKYEREINEFLFKKYADKLFLSLTYQHISGKDLDNFITLKENMTYNNAKKNRQRYLNNLDMVFKEEEYIPSNICKICGSISNGDVCNVCDMHEELGEKIIRADFIVRVNVKDDSEKNEFDIFEFNIGYLILKKENLIENIERIHKSSSKIQVFALNSTEFLDSAIIRKLEEKNIQASFGFSFLGNTTPSHDKYGPLDFEHIAKISRGTKKLGILKMNMDNLEKLFEIGLGSTVSISRVSTMSSLLDIFISGYINETMKDYYILPYICPDCREKVNDIELTFSEDTIKVYREKEREGKTEKVCDKCAEKKIPILYIGHSGGDDILIIGPWDIIVKFSKDIRDKFKKYTCMNPDINISAGLHICGPKFPIDRAVRIADDMLNKSKTLGKGKNKISIFSETVMWESFDRFKGYDELLQLSGWLESLVETEKVSRGFVYSLLTLLRQTFGDLKDSGFEYKMIARIERKRYEHTLKYKLARNIKDKDIREELNKRLIVDKMLSWIEIPASIAILKWRQQ